MDEGDRSWTKRAQRSSDLVDVVCPQPSYFVSKITKGYCGRRPQLCLLNTAVDTVIIETAKDPHY